MGDEGGLCDGVGVEALRVGGGDAEAVALGALRGRGDDVVEAGHAGDHDFVAVGLEDDVTDAATEGHEGGVQTDEGHGGSRG